jgi:hypothetical protein
MKEQPSATHRALQEMTVYTSDGISKSVSIKQHGRTVTIEQETAYFHLDAQDNNLKLYVPHRKNHQHVCLTRQLPITLLKHLGVQDLPSWGELSSIITAPNLFVVDEHLHQGGIIEVEGIERSEEDRGDDSGEEPSSNEREHSPVSILQTPSRESFRELSVAAQSRENASAARLPTPVTPVSVESPSPPERVDLYRQLLDAVIRQAQSLSDLPQVGHTIVAPVSQGLALNTSLAVCSGVVNGKEVKIGAAGELFVSKAWSNVNKWSTILTSSRFLNYFAA